VDPFFERPYEATATASPAWENKVEVPATRTPNIKPKRKVAALFGAKKEAS
jgi:hypothetical protein